jgi:hypothetical protein
MAGTLSVVLKGEQRGGQEVYTVNIDRGTPRVLEYTPKEIHDVIQREYLRERRLELQRQEAVADAVDPSAIAAEIQTTQDILKDARAIEDFMT